MKSQFCIFLTVILMAAFSKATAAGIEGEWRTIDDETGITKSIVRITQTAAGDYQGEVVEILHSDRGPNPVCEKCPGEFKDKPIRGMVILWGLRHRGNQVYKGGEILDPIKGKIYKANLRLLEDGRLELRGFIGFSLIGRSQVWEPAS